MTIPSFIFSSLQQSKIPATNKLPKWNYLHIEFKLHGNNHVMNIKAMESFFKMESFGISDNLSTKKKIFFLGLQTLPN